MIPAPFPACFRKSQALMQRICHDKSLTVYTRLRGSAGGKLKELVGRRSPKRATGRAERSLNHAPRHAGLSQCFFLPVNGLHSTVLHIAVLAPHHCPFRRRYPPIRFVQVGRRGARSRKCHNHAGSFPWGKPPETSRYRSPACAAERRLLNKAFSDRVVGQDAPLDEPLTITFAARTKPSFVEAQHVGR